MGTSLPHGNTVRHIIVADEDPAVVAFILQLLRQDGHSVFHAYDAMSATQLASAPGTSATSSLAIRKWWEPMASS